MEKNIITIDTVLNDAKELVAFLDEKKATNPIIINLSSKSSVADAFIIVSGLSFVHLQSLQNYIIDFLQKRGYKKRNPSNVFSETPWILLDFEDIVIHLFTDEAREFYNIEKIWA